MATNLSVATLHALRALGWDIAIDVFGTGYSSLSYLQDLLATNQEIDRSLILRLDQG